MSVAILSLCGLSGIDAGQVAASLLDIDSGGPDRLDRLLVLDDTALLTDHLEVYAQIDTAHRVNKLMCVTIGPRAEGGRKLDLPGNLGGVQGAPVLWMSRPAGIDWSPAQSLVANRHPGVPPATTERHPLISLLSVPEIFDRVHETFLDHVPARVASPGLKLAGEEDEAATFAGALAVAIRRVCEPGGGQPGPFGELMPDQAGGAQLTETGPLARYLGRIGELDRAAMQSLERAGGIGTIVRRGGGEVTGHVTRIGEALSDLRNLVAQVLAQASTDGGTGALTPNQQVLVRNAGLEFRAAGAPRPVGAPTGSAPMQSAVYRAVAQALGGGDPLPAVSERLIVTERLVGRKGSAAYLPEVEIACPAGLLAALASPPKVARHGGAARARQELRIGEAVAAGRALVALIIAVANREWSPATVTSGDLVRAKAALDGARRALTGFASEASGNRAATRAARLARLGENLMPALRDLIVRVAGAELDAASASGPEALKVARERTNALVAEWTALVQGQGVMAQPSFAGDATRDAFSPIEDEVATVRDALMYPVRDEMWQLCTPADLRALDVDVAPLSVRFASRLAKDALNAMPGDEPVWTSSGKFAGVLRLVSLRPGVVESTWGKAEPVAPSSGLES